MKKIAHVIAALIVLFVFTAGIKKSTGPPGCHSNEPPTGTNCTACHTGLVQGTAQVDMELNGADTAYIPGHVYTFTISVKKPGMQAAGFQFIALQNNNLAVSPGTVTLTDPTRTQKIDPGNPHLMGCLLQQKVWVEHKLAGITSTPQGESIWSFQWKAPDLNVGGITFYLAALETNNSGDELGDATHTLSITSNAVVSGIEEEIALNNSIVYFDAADMKVKIRSTARSINAVEIKDIRGLEIKKFEPASKGESNIDLDVSELSAGIYFVSLKGKEGAVVKKIVKGF